MTTFASILGGRALPKDRPHTAYPEPEPLYKQYLKRADDQRQEEYELSLMMKAVYAYTAFRRSRFFHPATPRDLKRLRTVAKELLRWRKREGEEQHRAFIASGAGKEPVADFFERIMREAREEGRVNPDGSFWAEVPDFYWIDVG